MIMNMVASTNNLVMEKHQTLQQEAILKCPRCDSSNTKFCYYNNYSLSQPRHFCKACKRYWTRGGTLRNVPVGGGCRRNKRVKKAAAVAGGAVVDSLPPLSTPMTTTNPNSSSSHSQIDRISSLFYGVNSNISSSDHNLSFSRYNSRVDTTLFDLQQPQVNVIGFSSPSLIASTDVATPNSMFSNYVTSPMLRSSNSSVSANMASLINSNLESQKSINPHNNIFGLVPNYADMQMEGNTNFQNRLNQIEATNDPNSSLFSVGGWFDSSNISYSVPSLI